MLNPRLQFIKGFYRRPLRVDDKLQAGGGGRVTELTARPLLNLFYPELSGVIQPLSGKYGGRRAALEQLTATSRGISHWRYKKLQNYRARPWWNCRNIWNGHDDPTVAYSPR